MSVFEFLILVCVAVLATTNTIHIFLTIRSMRLNTLSVQTQIDQAAAYDEGMRKQLELSEVSNEIGSSSNQRAVNDSDKHNERMDRLESKADDDGEEWKKP